MSQSGSATSISTGVTPRFSDQRSFNTIYPSLASSETNHKQNEHSHENLEFNFIREDAENVNTLTDSQSKSNDPVNEMKANEISSTQHVNESANGGETGILHNCGLLPNNCLPCLAGTTSSVEKVRSLNSSPPSMKKKAALRLSFKWRDGQPNPTLRKGCFLFLYCFHFPRLHMHIVCVSCFIR